MHVQKSVKFAAGVSFYPFCFSAAATPEFYSPVIIIIGSNDDWTPARNCMIWGERQNPDGAPLEVNVIEGAYHSFDLFERRGRLLGSRYIRGHHLVPSGEATSQSREILEAFLAKHDL